jgi:thioredoxin reductase (NADPH)
MEEAIHMSHFGSKVLIFVRTSKLRASKAMEEKAMKNPKIEFVWNTEITHIHGEKYINSVTTINNQTQEVSRIELG